jgi:homoserine O-acetyltransferase
MTFSSRTLLFRDNPDGTTTQGAFNVIRRKTQLILALAAALLFSAQPSHAQATNVPAGNEANYVIHDFHFKSGESLPELRIHYVTFGKPERDKDGRVTNAVLILHGTSGSSRSLLNPIFAGVLFAPGGLLDISHYYVIVPDSIGHGKSSKPSDGLHAKFPQYDYDDMVAAQHELVEKGLGVNHLRLVMGTSMGCMHSWVWGETYPDFMDALMPLACQPVQIAGRNRMFRKMTMDAIREDPDWKNGDYTAEPQESLEFAADIFILASSAPLQMQKSAPTRDDADKLLADSRKRLVAGFDANDLLYALNASRNYDPSGQLGKIQAWVMFVNSADDFINPPELGIAEREIKRVRNGRFVLIPVSDQTHGHGTHTYAAVWQEYLKELLDESKP